MTDKFTLFVYCKILVLLSTTVYSQNINKQNVNIADENITYYSFLRRYRFTESRNYLKRRYRIRHWIPMFIGTPCSLKYYNVYDISWQIHKFENQSLWQILSSFKPSSGHVCELPQTFGPDRFSHFAVYWIQTERQTTNIFINTSSYTRE